MLLQIADVLDRPTLAAIRDALARPSLWEDGGETAKGRARAVKNNLQARLSDPAAKGVSETIAAAILANDTIRAAALPAAIARLMLNRYDEGMEYGAHVDAPYIDGVRTDLSFTLFLNEPDEYGGGALVIDSAGAEDAVRLPAGSLVLYPSTYLHRVERVTRGSRFAAVGWIRSRVRSAERRAMLFELETALADLAAAGAPGPVRDRLANLRNNLIRDFGE